MGAGQGRSNGIMVQSSVTTRCPVPTVGDDRNQLAACLASISDIALDGGELLPPECIDQATSGRLSRGETSIKRTTETESSGGGGGGGGGDVSCGGRSLRLRLKQRLRRNRSSEEARCAVYDNTPAGDGSTNDEVARNHRQLLDSLDSKDDDSTDWAAMRQWLVWCLREKLGDTELHMFDRMHRRHRRVLRHQKLHHNLSADEATHQMDGSVDVDDFEDDNGSSRTPPTGNLVSLSSSAPQTHIALLVPPANPRLVRQHAVHERSPRASYGGSDCGSLLGSGLVGLPRGYPRSGATTSRGESISPSRRYFRCASSDSSSTTGVRQREPEAGYGARRQLLISMASGVTNESKVERLTVKDASYSGGSSFESYGSAG